MKRFKEYLYGNSSVIPALEQHKRRLFQLYFNPNSINPLFPMILKKAQEKSIPIVEMTSSKLDKLTDSRPNQGVALFAGSLDIPMAFGLDCNERQYIIDTGDEKIIKNCNRKYPLFVGLDRIMDPQNLGAILRTCYFFGVDGILITTKESAPLSPFVSKASSGAMEIMDLYGSPKLKTLLQNASENGFCIYGTNFNSPNTLELEPKANTPSLFNGPTILVLGNEGSGQRASISNLCDVNLKINGFHSEDEDYRIDSLNVSVATGILLQKIMNT